MGKYIRDTARTMMGQLGIKPGRLISALESPEFNARLNVLLEHHSGAALGRIVEAVRARDLLELARDAIAEAMAEEVFAKPHHYGTQPQEDEEVLPFLEELSRCGVCGFSPCCC